MPPSDMLDGIPEPLWRRVRAASARVLLLDYDGTIAPLRARREDAATPPEVRARLERVRDSGATSLAIVSGRPLHELEERLAGLGVALYGTHGTEWKRPGEREGRAVLPADDARALADAYARARAWTDGPMLERKHGAIVLHARTLPATERSAMLDACEATWAAFARGGTLRFDRGEASAELRVRAPHKGMVVRERLTVAPEGAIGVFVGDDVTDEDAFEAVRAHGFGVRVGDEHATTFAEGRLPGAEAMTAFLDRWLETTNH